MAGNSALAPWGQEIFCFCQQVAWFASERTSDVLGLRFGCLHPDMLASLSHLESVPGQPDAAKKLIAKYC